MIALLCPVTSGGRVKKARGVLLPGKMAERRDHQQRSYLIETHAKQSARPGQNFAREPGIRQKLQHVDLFSILFAISLFIACVSFPSKYLFLRTMPY